MFRSRQFFTIRKWTSFRYITNIPKPTPLTMPISPLPTNQSSSGTIYLILASITLGAASGYYYFTLQEQDYQKVYNEIATRLEQDYDDGSFGPILVRLAWHAAGTFDEKTKTGGSNGSTMRFSPESAHGINYSNLYRFLV